MSVEEKSPSEEDISSGEEIEKEPANFQEVLDRYVNQFAKNPETYGGAMKDIREMSQGARGETVAGLREENFGKDWENSHFEKLYKMLSDMYDEKIRELLGKKGIVTM